MTGRPRRADGRRSRDLVRAGASDLSCDLPVVETARSSGAERRRLKARGARIVLAGVGLQVLLYAPSLTGLFTFDDRKIVLEDASITGVAPLWDAFLRPYFSAPGATNAIAYRPATVCSLGLDARLFGLSPFAMRLENILWAGVGAGLFALLAARLGAPPEVSWSVLALLSAHPVRSEAIVTIVGRSELMAFAFVVSAILLGQQSWRFPDAPRRVVYAAASGAVILLALLSKESAFAAPALLLLVSCADGARPDLPKRQGALHPVFIAWGAAFVAAALLRRSVLGGILTGPSFSVFPVDNALAGLPPFDRVLAAMALLPRAAGLLLWPRTLVADYGSQAIPVSHLLTLMAVAAGAATVIAAGLIALRVRRTVPLAALGIGWVAASYLPFANVFYPTAVLFAERLLYTPCAGAVLAVASGLYALGQHKGTRAARGAALSSVVVLAFLGIFRIESRLPEWRDDRTLFSAVVRDMPTNGRAWWNLAVVALSDRDPAVAQQCLTAALRAEPSLRPSVESLRAHAVELRRADLVAAIDAALASPR